MAENPGRDERSLRKLAEALARQSFFGDSVIAISSPSGKCHPGQLLSNLDQSLLWDLSETASQNVVARI